MAMSLISTNNQTNQQTYDDDLAVMVLQQNSAKLNQNKHKTKRGVTLSSLSCVQWVVEETFLLTLVFSLLVTAIASPVKENDVKETSNNIIKLSRQKRDFINDDTQRYLMKYGYLPMSDMETGNLRTEKQLRKAIKTMQRFGHINQTGQLDSATKELMTKRRCGLPDLPPDFHNPYNSFSLRSKRFVKQGARWNHIDLTWGIRTYPHRMRDRTGDKDHLSRWEIHREFRLATEVWGRASKLVFKELEEDAHKADIVIDFQRGYHGDGYPFDGAGMTLAHAFYPGEDIGGDMHFDSDELWIQHKDSGSTWDKVSLFITAAHELGHALGLYHSDVEGSLMSPYLIKFPINFKLPKDDIRGIQELYGTPDNWSPDDTQPEEDDHVPPPTDAAPTDPPRPPDIPAPPDSDSPPDTCDTDYDAISVIRREIYIFKGKYFWRIDPSGRLRKGYPAEIIRFWSRLPKNFTHIDAVYERPHDNSIVFFIGSRYYVCQGNDDLLETGPLKKFGLPETLHKIDAAMVWGHNGRTYFFADTMYWRFDEDVSHVELDYPRDMVMWNGVPYNIDSSFKFNGTTYFFKGKVFWQFDDLRMKVKPRSPALAAPFWMGCPNTKESELVKRKELSSQKTTSLANYLNAQFSIIALSVLFLLLSPR